ncbi:Error-prone repair protein ImuA [Cyclobacterium sp.]|uniref:ImuA family protein n=1 Tax=Cyclobacterium sp. TaxID=1966343 RepID=UPI0019844BF3|nr:Error-prone repair protein ImuA [Cyclobacterium sp.]MBD3630001.1 Error-prone repair protein ImuA [Cyclobacterium sp.]
MKLNSDKIEQLRQLKQEIMELEGYIPQKGQQTDSRLQLGPLHEAFPGRAFPLAANHEFISHNSSEAASTQGFLAVILGMLMQKGGFCLWLGTCPQVFPPALKCFGLAPERVLFVNVPREKDLLWTLEQALSCEALVAVVGEMRELGFSESQRLQLAVERSRVTGFLHRHQPRSLHALACATRWKLAPLPSTVPAGMPGMGWPAWKVSLLKARNGKPGHWQLQWDGEGFQELFHQQSQKIVQNRKNYA